MKRFALLVATASMMVAVDMSVARAQSLCDLLGCPPGPAGPQGPAGPAGGFDASSVYSKECPNTTACSCDAGDVLLSGGASCNPGVSVLLHSRASDSAPLSIWIGTCSTLDAANVLPAVSIRITCAVP
jgi:hypothetical protein